MQFLNAKTRTVTRSFETRIFTFNHETKFIETVQKLSKNSRSDQKWGDRTIPPAPEYATDTRQTLCAITEHYGTDTMHCPHYCIV